MALSPDLRRRLAAFATMLSAIHDGPARLQIVKLGPVPLRGRAELVPAVAIRTDPP